MHPAAGGYRCDMNDIEALLAGAIDTGQTLTYTNPEHNVVVCHPGDAALVR
ncbi:hypothetical protein ACFY9A_38610 [Streptomyces rubradiris]|uniref:hypothetical protein n=1 Tax=Streptomyces rubradiris TaxID=285531 RepID=UPI0036EFADA3